MTTEQMKQAELESEEYCFVESMRSLIIRLSATGETEKLKAAETFLREMGYTYSLNTYIDRWEPSHKWTVCEIEKNPEPMVSMELIDWVNVLFAYEEKPKYYTTEYAATDLKEFGSIISEYPELGEVTPETYAAAVNYCIKNIWKE